MESYMREAFIELFNEDGLTVLGHGLGMPYLFCKFLECYLLQSTSLPKPLVLCINAMDHVPLIHQLLRSTGVAEEALPEVINNETNAQERCEMYQVGGCFFITSRILIVDLLDNKLDASKVAGLLVYNAHRISETSLDSFILRIYRERNRSGFLKAFSEEAEALTGPFLKVERLLRSLYLTKIYLWPRFRLEVNRALEGSMQSNVIELSIPLTKHMQAIQSAVLVAMNTCISELKKACPSLDTTNWTLQNGLFHNFDNNIRMQLDPDWHRIAFRTKQIVGDLTVLRKLLDYLVRYDAFSFYYLLMKLHAASKEQYSPSLWLTTAAAEQIYKHAKARVYALLPSNAKHKWQQILGVQKLVNQTMETLKLAQVLEPTLECPPKYNVLLEIVKEIRDDFVKSTPNRPVGSESKQSAEEATSASSAAESEKGSTVLLIVRDELALTQLKDLLLSGKDHVMDSRFRWFISQEMLDIRRKMRYNMKEKAGANRIRPAKYAASEQTGKFYGDVGDNEAGNSVLDSLNEEVIMQELMAEDGLEAASSTAAQGDKGFLSSGFTLEQVKAQLTEEQKLLLLQYNVLQHTPAYSDLASRTTSRPVQNPKKRKANTLGGKMTDKGLSTANLHKPYFTNRSSSSNQLQSSSSISHETLLFDMSFADYQSDGTAMNKHSHFTLFKMPDSRKKDEDASDEDEIVVEDKEDLTGLRLVFVTHSQVKSESLSLFKEQKPLFVVLYDADVEIVRTIEVYQSTLAFVLKVYFLVYEGSTEEHRYAGTLAKEKKAFESLIQTKEHMVVSLPDNLHDLKQEQMEDNLLAMDSRSRKQFQRSNKVIVVDVREFRSILPSLLYTSMYYSQLLPRTVYVGDYILSSEICVERKSISDLFQSFASGRLYNQCEAMSKYYKFPCVLIEFSIEKAFCLVASSEIAADIQASSILSKIVLLTQSFPQLRLLWSRSPQTSVEIFRSIAVNHEQADLHKAMTVGAGLYAGRDKQESLEEWIDSKGSGRKKNGGVGRGLMEEQEEECRTTAQDILLSLPGINVHNFRGVMDKVENIAALTKMSEVELTPLIGAGNARKLVAFCKQRLV